MPEKLFVQSNRGSGQRWWTRGSDGATIQTNPPAAYRWLLDKRLLEWNHMAMAVYVTEKGEMCCLLAGLRSGIVVGNSRVIESLLLVNDEPHVTDLHRRLAFSFLRMPPADTLENTPGAGEIRSVLAAIGGAGNVEVDWAAMIAAIQAIPDHTTIAAAAAPSYGEDDCENRDLVCGLLKQLGRANPGELVAVVAPFSGKRDFAAVQVAFGLSRHDSVKGKRLGISLGSAPSAQEIAPEKSEPAHCGALQSTASAAPGEPEQQPLISRFSKACMQLLLAWIARLLNATPPEE